MPKHIRLLLPVFLVALVLPSMAWADPVIWTLNNVNFTGGGSATGTFTYDSDTDTFSNINIVTTPGGIFDGATYVQRGGPNTDSLGGTRLGALTVAGPVDGATALTLRFDTALGNAGGTVAFFPGFSASNERVCVGGNCGPEDFRVVAAGATVVGVPATPVPTLSEWAMILLALALAAAAALSIQRRRMKA